MLKDAKNVEEYVLLNALLHIFVGLKRMSSWFDAHVHDHSWWTSSSVSLALSDISYAPPHLPIGGQAGGLRWVSVVTVKLCFSFHA